MTGDAQAEAERIVSGLVACGASTDSDRLGEYCERHESVVAALAAAIEVVQDEASLTTVRKGRDGRGWIKVPSDQQLRALEDALSALRARAGEETG